MKNIFKCYSEYIFTCIANIIKIHKYVNDEKILKRIEVNIFKITIIRDDNEYIYIYIYIHI